MNEEQYRSLCDACDKALEAGEETIERVAIPFLHVIREHPMLLVAYAELFDSPSHITRLTRRLLQAARNKASWVKQMWRAIGAGGQPYLAATELPSGADVLFVSHLLNESFAGKSHDFYYGDLPNQLAMQGRSVVIAMINYTGKPGTALVSKWREFPVPRAIFPDSLTVPEEADLYHRLRNEAARMRHLARGSPEGLYRNVLFTASRAAVSGGAISAMRLGMQVRKLVKDIQPKAIVVTHEGHAWERVAFAAARQASPGIRCIGYQHAALFRLQHAIQRGLDARFNPDAIVTAGEVSRHKLERAPGLRELPISVIGSNRAFHGVPAGNECSSNSAKAEQAEGGACLVLPEGFVSECHLLFQFSLACAKALPEMRFIWRLHPNVTFGELARGMPDLRDLPHNIELSTASLEDDTLRSGWVLYRGTTAVVQAVVAGARPVYLRLPDEMTIDPIYEVNDWRAIVSTVDEFLNVVHPGPGCNADSPLAAAAREYCQSFFTPLDVEAMSSVLPARG